MAEKVKKDKKLKKKGAGVIKEFAAFINRGSVVDLAVGVIIGGAFSAIVTAVVNILMSLCLCFIPGGFGNLITPIFTTHAPEGYQDTYSVTEFLEISKTWGNTEAGMYKQYGSEYIYGAIPVLNWGALITAVIDFLVIAVVLFLVVKAVAKAKAQKEALDAKLREEYLEKHPEERPVAPVPGVPAPTELDILIQIRDELKKSGAAAPSSVAK